MVTKHAFYCTDHLTRVTKSYLLALGTTQISSAREPKTHARIVTTYGVQSLLPCAVLARTWYIRMLPRNLIGDLVTESLRTNNNQLAGRRPGNKIGGIRVSHHITIRPESHGNMAAYSLTGASECQGISVGSYCSTTALFWRTKSWHA